MSTVYGIDRNEFLPCLVCGSFSPLPQIHYGRWPRDFYVHDGACREKSEYVQKLASSVDPKFGFVRDKISLFLGAGISIRQGIPGTKIFLRRLYGRNTTIEEFGRDLLGSTALRQRAKSLFTNYHAKTLPGIAHLVSSRLMVRDLLNSVITTNWDLLLELAMEEQLYIYTAFYFERGGEPDMFKNPIVPSLRKCLVVQDAKSLGNIRRNVFPNFKLHGSPLLYECPRCSGLSRYKLIPRHVVVDGALKCARHPQIDLTSEMLLPGEKLDLADKNVFETVKTYLDEASIVLAVGYSGSDDYVLSGLLLPYRDKLWVIKREKRGEPIELIANEERTIYLDVIQFFRCFEVVLNVRGIRPILSPREAEIDKFLKFRANIDFSGYSEVKPYYERLFTRRERIDDILNKAGEEAARRYAMVTGP